MVTTERSSIDQFLQDFRETIQLASARLKGISAEQSCQERQSGKWTPKEILGHLIDSAANNHRRFVQAQYTDDLVFPGYEQNDWVSVQKYKDESWPDLIQLWISYNLHLLHLISVIPEPVLTRPRSRHNLDQIAWKTVARSEPTTLDYFIRDYVGHLRHHLGQIFGDTKPL